MERIRSITELFGVKFLPIQNGIHSCQDSANEYFSHKEGARCALQHVLGLIELVKGLSRAKRAVRAKSPSCKHRCIEGTLVDTFGNGPTCFTSTNASFYHVTLSRACADFR